MRLVCGVLFVLIAATLSAGDGAQFQLLPTLVLQQSDGNIEIDSPAAESDEPEDVLFDFPISRGLGIDVEAWLRPKNEPAFYFISGVRYIR